MSVRVGTCAARRPATCGAQQAPGQIVANAIDTATGQQHALLLTLN